MTSYNAHREARTRRVMQVAEEAMRERGDDPDDQGDEVPELSGGLEPYGPPPFDPVAAARQARQVRW